MKESLHRLYCFHYFHKNRLHKYSWSTYRVVAIWPSYVRLSIYARRSTTNQLRLLKRSMLLIRFCVRIQRLWSSNWGVSARADKTTCASRFSSDKNLALRVVGIAARCSGEPIGSAHHPPQWLLFQHGMRAALCAAYLWHIMRKRTR